MASVVATREILQKHHHKIKAVVIASQLRGDSTLDQLKVARKLIKRSSYGFFAYKIIESKLYNLLLSTHKILRSRRYKQGKASSISELATKYNIPVIRTNDLSNPTFLEEINTLRPDYVLCIVAQILKKKVFEMLGNKLINAHGSYLPEYRGAAQYFWYLQNNEEQFGITIHFMEAGLDTGDIIFQKRFRYNQNCTAYRLHYMIAKCFGRMLNEFIDDYADQDIIAYKQEEENATVASMPNREDVRSFRVEGKKMISTKDFLRSI